MSQGYVIQWKSMVNGRAGRGSKKFSKSEAERLANELNEEYPDIIHEPIVAPPPKPELVHEEENAALENEDDDLPVAVVGH